MNIKINALTTQDLRRQIRFLSGEAARLNVELEMIQDEYTYNLDRILQQRDEHLEAYHTTRDGAAVCNLKLIDSKAVADAAEEHIQALEREILSLRAKYEPIDMAAILAVFNQEGEEDAEKL